MKIRKNSGFTVVEVLAAVAILAILLGVAVVSTINYVDMLKLTELDNAAREIYMAAENRSVLLLGAQETDTVFEGLSTVTLNVSGPEISLLAASTDDTAYLTKAGIKASKALLANGNIEPVLWDGDGDFIIAYDKTSGSVTEVFYVEKKPGDIEYDEILTCKGADRATRPSLKSDTDGKILVGYYNGDAAQGADIAPTPATGTPIVTVKIENDIQLKATVKVDFGFSGISDATERTELQAAVKEAITGGRLSVELRQADGTGSVYPLTPYGGWSGKISGNIFECTWTLDTLANGTSGDIVNIRDAGITPGENFIVTATLASYDGSFGTAYDSAGDNSLFATGSGGGTALIRNLRHLQNLKDATSWESFSARQLAAVDGNADIDGDGNADDYTFVPIDNPYLATYDGQGNEIRNLNVEASADEPAGLFSTVSGEEAEKHLQNIRMRNTTVTGQDAAGVVAGAVSGNVVISGCRVYWDDGSLEDLKEALNDGDYPLAGDTAGGLVGLVSGSVRIENSLAATLVDGTSAAGGLVGRAESGAALIVKNSYADCYLTGTGTVAGLVGELAGASADPAKGAATAALTDCYAAGFIMGAGTDGVKRQAAGLCMGDGTTTTANVYSAMVWLADGENEAPPYRLTAGEADTDTAATSDVFGDTYFQGSGKVYGKDTSAQGKDLTSESVFNAMAEKGGFDKVPKVPNADPTNTALSKKTYPYNLRWETADGEEAKLTAYDYPGLANLPHYGDWGKVDVDVAIPVGLAYRELYSGGIYGVFGFNGQGEPLDYNMYNMKTDADTKTIIGYGYAVVFSAEDVDGYDAVTIRINGNAITSKKTGDESGDGWETITLDDGTKYYIVSDLDALQPDSTAVTDFYIYLKLGMKLGADEEIEELEGESEYYFNPHFAKTVKALPEEAPEDTSWSDAAAKQSYTAKMLPDEDGEVTDWAYIRTPGQLDNLNGGTLTGSAKYYNQGYAFRQELDLVLTSSQTPIGMYYNDSSNDPFTGTYDGDGHTISGLNVTAGFNGSHISNGLGLFASVGNGSAVKNLTVKGTAASDVDHVGGIVGNNSGTVENCHSYVTVTGRQYAGGIVGNNSGTVENCHSYATVTGTSRVGGVAGNNASGDSMVKNCSNVGSVTGTGTHVGGIVGYNVSGTVQSCYNTGDITGYGTASNATRAGGVVGMNSDTVLNCYNTGRVEGYNYAGGVAGYNTRQIINCYSVGEVEVTSGTVVGGIVGNSNGGTQENCYFLEYTPGTANRAAGNSSSSAGSLSRENFAAWDTYFAAWNATEAGNVWTMAGDTPYIGGYRPILKEIPESYEGTADAPYIINNRLDLENVGAVVNGGNNCTGKYFKLTEDIQLHGSINPWIPIGNNTNNNRRFQGDFNGGGHKLTGLYINGEGRDYGLFGYNAGVIHDLTVEDGNVKGNSHIGGIVGYNGGTVEECRYSGQVSGGSEVGGIVGRNEYGGARVSNCTNQGEITADGGSRCGGVVGINVNGGTVENCANAGTVSGGTDAGGIVGMNANSSSVTLEECDNEGGVTGTGNNVGGIVGNNSNGSTVTLEGCGNEGNVTGADRVGGIVGNNSSNSTVTLENCVNEGTVTGSNGAAGGGIGGIVGLNDGGGAVNNCVNDGEVAGIGSTSNTGGVVGFNSTGCTVTLEGCVNNGTVTGNSAVGGIVGRDNRTADVSLCANTGLVEATGGSYAGGIVGIRRFGPVEICYNTGTVMGANATAGGIAGFIQSSDVKNCYSTGDVSSYNAGGVVGVSNTGDEITNCYNIGSVTGGGNVGGILGNGNADSVENCYYLDGTASGGIKGADVDGRAESFENEYFFAGEVFDGWAFVQNPDDEGVWAIYLDTGITDSATRPLYRPGLVKNLEDRLKPTDISVVVRDAAGLADFRNRVNSGETDLIGILLNDIELQDDDWEPIGTVANSFSGTFFGNGKTISGLYINNQNTDVGLFGYVSDGGAVKNLTVEGSVTGAFNVGGIVGRSFDGTVEDCTFIGDVSSSNEGDTCVGGIVGNNSGPNGKVINCTNGYDTGGEPDYTRMVMGDYRVGGIVGTNNNQNGEVTGCRNYAIVRGTNSAGGIAGMSGGKVTDCENYGEVMAFASSAGGIVGQNSETGIVISCDNHSAVAAYGDSADSVGGIVGQNSGAVSICYNAGSVGDSGKNAAGVGGVVGLNNSPGTVNNCYSTGDIMNGNNVGGVVGQNDSVVAFCYNTGAVTGSTSGGVVGLNNGTAKNCYYLESTVAGGTSTGDVEGGAEKKNSSEFKTSSAFPDWDPSIWTWSNGERPTLSDNPETSARLDGTGAARVVTAAVGGGIPGNGTWTVSVNSEDGAAAASFAQGEEVSAMDDGGSGTAPLYITGPDGGEVVLSVTYTYAAEDAAEDAGEGAAEALRDVSGQAWAAAALPPKPEVLLPKAKDPDDEEPGE